MKKLQKFFALTTAMAMLASSAYGQDYAPEYDGGDERPYAYEDSGDASEMSALLPIGVLAFAGLIVAFSHTGHHNRHHQQNHSHSHSHSH